MTSKAAIVGAVLSAGAVAMWVSLAVPAGREAHEAATAMSRAAEKLDARLPTIAGPEIEQRVLETARDRARVCDAFEAPRLAASSAIFEAPLEGVDASASLDEWRRVLGVRRQEAGHDATRALRAAGGPDVAGWPYVTPAWIEPSAPDPTPEERARDLARFRLDVKTAAALASAGALATEVSDWTLTAGTFGRRADAVFRFAVPTRGVSGAVARVVTVLQESGAVVVVSGISVAPPPAVRAGFGGDPPVDVVLRVDARFPVAGAAP